MNNYDFDNDSTITIKQLLESEAIVILYCFKMGIYNLYLYFIFIYNYNLSFIFIFLYLFFVFWCSGKRKQKLSQYNDLLLIPFNQSLLYWCILTQIKQILMSETCSHISLFVENVLINNRHVYNTWSLFYLCVQQLLCIWRESQNIRKRVSIRSGYALIKLKLNFPLNC